MASSQLICSHWSRPRSSPWALAPPPGCQLLRFMGNFTRSSPKTCWARARPRGHPRCCSHSKLSSWEVSLPWRTTSPSRTSTRFTQRPPQLSQHAAAIQIPSSTDVAPAVPARPSFGAGELGAQATRDDRAPAETAATALPFKNPRRERSARLEHVLRIVHCVPLLSLLDSAKAAPWLLQGQIYGAVLRSTRYHEGNRPGNSVRKITSW